MAVVFTKKDIQVSRQEALRFLFKETSNFGGMIASTMSSLLTVVFALAVLYWVDFIELPQTTGQIIALSVTFLMIGIVLFLIRQQECYLFDKTHSNSFLRGVFSIPFSIVVFTAIFLILLFPSWQQQSLTAEVSPSTSVITVMLIATAASFAFNAIWEFFLFYFMQLFTKRDWFILAEREMFIEGMGLRFEEARRYGTPLSLVRIQLPNFSPKEKRLLRDIFTRVTNSLRDIDSFSHMENRNDLGILAPISGVAAEGIFHRIAKLINEELYNRGYKEDCEVVGLISSIQADTETEFDLLKTQKKLTTTISFE